MLGEFTLTNKLTALAVAALFCGSLTAQQTTGSITGFVKDPSGASLANVKVTAKNVETGLETQVETSDEGRYLFPSLRIGNYTISVEAAGFRKLTTSPILIGVASTVRQDLNMEVGQVSESITVEATSNVVNTMDAQLGRSVRDIPNLPILSGAGGRNPLTLVQLQPGVNTQGQVGPFSVNGQRAQANNFLLDGTDTNDIAINIPNSVQSISPDAIEEFRLITGAMKAEYGRNSGAVVEVTTKGGSNQWHGGANYIFRNTLLNATPFFQNSIPGGTPERLANGFKRKPQWNTNDFDARFGGKIIQDKTFFFVNYLGFRRRQGVVNSATVPTLDQRNIILTRGTPQARALMALLPGPNSGSNLLLSSPSNSNDRDNGLARVDHYFSEKNQFAFTYFHERQRFTDPFAFGGSPVPGFGTLGKLNFTNVVLRDTHTFSPNLILELRAAFNRRATLSVIPLNRTSLSSLGLNNIVPADSESEGPPRVDLVGFSNFGNTIQGPQGRYVNTFHYLGNLTYIRGKHTFKFGADFRPVAQNQVFNFIPNAYFIFDGSATAQGLVPRIPGLPDVLNDFANGLALQVVQNSPGRRGYRTKGTSAFAQDDWRISRRLTLNLGLRWEFNTPLVELRDRVFTFRPGQQSSIFPTAPRGIVFPGDQGISRSTYDADYNNFAGRFGFAFDVFGNGKLAVRGGYGSFFDTPVSELTLQFLTSAPYAIQPATFYSPIDNPWRGSQVNPIPPPFPFAEPQAGAQFNFANIAPIPMTIMSPTFATPYSHNFNFDIQWNVTRDWLVTAGYVGNMGVKLLNRQEINYGLVTPTATSGNINPRRIFNLGNPQSPAFGGAVFGGITNQTTDAQSNYHALQFFVTKRYSRGLTITGAYTWSKAIDNASGLRVASNPFSSRADRGRSEQDLRHRAVFSYVYDFPWMKDQQGFLGRIIGGWGISGITTFQTGTPVNITEPQDRCLCGGGNQRPDYIGGNLVYGDPRGAINGRANSWFDGTGGGSGGAVTNPFFRRVGTAATAAAGAGRYGNVGRNTLTGPGIQNWDVSLYKRFRITERHRFELRGEAFNITNQAQFLNPVGSIGSPLFGQITATRDPRILQISARYFF
jgi:hypothetical protein